jgi:hypothetical protein
MANGSADQAGQTVVDIDALPSDNNGFTPSILDGAARRNLRLVFKSGGLTLTFTYRAMLQAIAGTPDSDLVYVIVRPGDNAICREVASTLGGQYKIVNELVYEILFKKGNQWVTGFSDPVKIEVDLTGKPLSYAQLSKLKALRYKNQSGIQLGGENQWSHRRYTFYTGELSVYLLAPAHTLTQIRLAVGDPAIYVNEAPFLMDVSPELVNDRVMVPLRFLYECLDASVEWNRETRIIKVGNRILNLSIEIGRLQEGMDTAPYIKQDRAFVPVRFVTETLGGYVEWREEGQMVYIIYRPDR